MTQYFTDFGEYSVSEDVRNSDWSEPFEVFDTVNIVDPGDGNRLELESGGSSVWYYLSWDAVENAADTEVLALIEFLENQHGAMLSHYGNAARGDGTNENLWRYGGGGDNTLKLQVRAAGFTNTKATESMNAALGTLYWFKSQSDGLFHRVKWWEDGTGEPGTWNLEVEDSAVDTSGTTGILLDYSCKTQVLRFGVGTNGDTAPASGVEAPTGLTVSQNNENLLSDWTSNEGEFILQRERYVGSGDPS